MDDHRTFFITTVTWGRRQIFRQPRTARVLVDVLFHYQAHNKYLLHEFVIMPDHLHALITPAPGLSLERAMQFIKGGFSHGLAYRLPVWQPSFTDHRIRDSEDYQHHRNYMHSNPVRAQLVPRSEDYPYSSAYPGFVLDPPAQGLKPRVLESV
jgi:putative transposase